MKVFIDGQSGTTGLKIAARLKNMADIKLLTLDDTQRRDLKNAKKRSTAATSPFYACLTTPRGKPSLWLKAKMSQ
jgi:N-acetyl-gamma-glutamyl-phosphate reductase